MKKLQRKETARFSLPDGNFVVCDYEHFRLTKNKQKAGKRLCGMRHGIREYSGNGWCVLPLSF